MSLLGTQLLENLLRAEPGAFDRLLRAHGPVVPGEVDLLAERARDSSARVRHNATVLLGIARAPDRDAVLRVLARDTSDPVVLVLAARALPDGAAIAATRPALLKAAEDADDPAVVAAAIALRGRGAETDDDLRARLASPERPVREAALKMLADGGAGALGAEVRAMLVDPARRLQNRRDLLFRIVLGSDDPAGAEALARSLDGASVADQVALTNAIGAVEHPPPWLRGFLLERLKTDDAWRWTALRLLAAADDPPLAELVAVCRDHLAARLASGEPEKHVANEAGVAACGTFLVKLAGTSLPDLRAVLDFANGWTPPA